MTIEKINSPATMLSRLESAIDGIEAPDAREAARNYLRSGAYPIGQMVNACEALYALRPRLDEYQRERVAEAAQMCNIYGLHMTQERSMGITHAMLVDISGHESTSFSFPEPLYIAGITEAENGATG